MTRCGEKGLEGAVGRPDIAAVEQFRHHTRLAHNLVSMLAAEVAAGNRRRLC
jgi:hypothetical protein